ncbi:MAG: DEAD/DEAH box helicase, partial [Candidatus Riflebacteria bacterium]|nr:DEAD/DEAH box helicase [Candidatus Riflebacteria bacterium]
MFKGPYVDLNLPFKRGKSIRALIDEGIVCKSFESVNNIDLDRPLYLHQEKSIRHIGKGRSAIVTTGTGSGKTECFLYPIINDLLFDYEKGNTEIGIRAIFLYPMNALVNDQIDRLRQLLENTPQITFGFFTGDTPETLNTKNKNELENECSLLPNELMSREEIRKNPPHILFTNYSMLEYLLIRPNDYSIFEPTRLKNWKYIVLDEAHTYYGSKGIELSMLMRRLTGLADKKPRFILTSATLGEKGKSENDIIKFANNLTSADFNMDDIIFSDKINMPQREKKYIIDPSDYVVLKEIINKKENIDSIVKKYDSNINKNDPSKVLYDLLKNDDNVQCLYSFLLNRSKTIDSILTHFKGKIDKNQLSALIDLINMADNNGIELFTLKYHSFLRPLNGAFITGDKTKLSLTKANFIDENKAFEVGNCRYCNAPYVIGRIIYNPEDKLSYLLQNSEIDIYENYGSDKNKSLDYFLFTNKIGEAEDEDEFDDSTNIDLIEHTVCGKCGAISETKNKNSFNCKCGDKYHFSLYKVVSNNKKEKFDFEAYNNIRECACCRHRSHTGIVKNLNLGKDEGTALVGRLLLESMDDEEGKHESETKKIISLRSNTQFIRKDIKQFLTFSDSRQQASFSV